MSRISLFWDGWQLRPAPVHYDEFMVRTECGKIGDL